MRIQGNRNRLLWASFAAGAIALAAGCNMTPDLEDVVDPKAQFEEADLTPSALAERMKEIDAAYSEPRTPARVQVSYETAMISISAVNNYDAVWRGLRACAWLGFNDPDRSRRADYARKGELLGKVAIVKPQLNTRVETRYWYAHCIAAMAELESDKARARPIRDQMALAQAFDPTYDHCGPLRFLGEFKVELDQYPTLGLGRIEDGLKLLKEACERCPDFGENHLKYAEALQLDGQVDKALREADRVLACPVPPDYTVEHKAWLEKATAIKEELSPGGPR